MPNTARGGRGVIPRGLTLIELLVVITILVMLLASIAPMFRPAIVNRRQREAARLVSTMLASAQSHAVTTGRPAGVLFQRTTNSIGSTEAAMDMYIVEVPAPYSGSSTTSCVKLNSSGQIIAFYSNLTGSVDSNWVGLIHNSDSIQLNYGGPIYQISAPAVDFSTTAAYTGLLSSVGTMTQAWTLINPDPHSPRTPPAFASPVPYQIFRQPVKTADAPVQLPEGAVVDLAWSSVRMGEPAMRLTTLGITKDAYELIQPTPRDLLPVIVMFKPTGALDACYCYQYVASQKSCILVPQTPPETLYLLVGKAEKTVPWGTYPWSSDYDPSETNDLKLEHHNWLDRDNFWVAVNQQTGLITTAEVGYFLMVDPNNVNAGNDTSSTYLDLLTQSRQFAQSAQNLGSR